MQPHSLNSNISHKSINNGIINIGSNGNNCNSSNAHTHMHMHTHMHTRAGASM